MKRLTHRAVSLSAFVLVVYVIGVCSETGGVASAQAASEGNLVVNGGFDRVRKGLPSGWTLQKNVAVKGSVSLKRANGSSGNALKLEPNSGNTPGPRPLGLGQAVAAAGLRGKRLRVSVRLGADRGAMAIVGVTVLREGGGKMGSVSFQQGDSGGRLELQEKTLEVQDVDGAKHMIIFVAVAGTKGAAYFDDFVVEEIDSPQQAPAADTGRADNTGPPLQAQIRVFVDQRVRDIPRTIYGTNLNWIDHGNSIFDPRTYKPNPRIVELGKALDVSLVRFPGGTLGDFYHWRDGVGPQRSRPASPAYGKGKEHRHTVGTVEAMDFAQSLGAKLLLVVNMGTGDADEAAGWVRYVNVGDRPKSQHVAYWEIGNELYMKGGMHSATMTPDEYARRFKEYARAMKSVDPSIKVGAIGGENFGRYDFVYYPQWNRKVLSEVADHADFFAVHNAYAPLIVGEVKAGARSVYEAFLAAPINIAQNLERTGRQIEAYTGKNADRIKIAVTEWGPLFSIDRNSPYIDHTKTLGSALFVASVLKAFIECTRVEVANFFKLSEHTFMGWIGPRGSTGPFNGTWIPKASYLAFQMYTKHFGGVLVRSVSDSPVYDSPRVGKVDAVLGVPYLEAVASTSSDGETLYVMVINKHFDRPAQTTMRIDGFQPAPRGRAWTLRGTGLDANTGTELPTWVPKITWAKQAQVEPERRFYAGKEGEVGISSTVINDAALTWTYTFPPRSVTSLELTRKR